MRSAIALNSNGSDVESILSVNQRRLTLAQKIASLGCWEYDIKSKSLWGSEEYFKILGLPEGPRETHFDEVDPLINEIDLVKKSMFDLITTGKEYSIEYSCIQKGTGKLIIVHSNAEPIRNDEGIVTKVIGTFQDITDQKRNNESKAVAFMTPEITKPKTTEKKMTELQFADLEKAKNELDHFAYSLSHDLKAPITTILGLLNLSNLENSKTNFEELKCLIKESAEKLETTINGMSDYFYNIRNEVQTQKIEFQNLIQELEKEIKDSSKINLQISINDSFPLHTDLKRLKKVFYHLWTNTIVFRSKLHAPNLKIKIKTTRDHALIIFQDNGIGIAQEDLSKVFQMFYRGSILSKGSGLGLAVVHETIAKLGGEIAVRSELGKYSIFEILLPNLSKEKELVLSV